MKKFLSLFLTIALLLCSIPLGVVFAETTTGTHNNTVIAYVPLDNRPVNLDRAEHLAAASGMTLLMPDESDVSTTLSIEGYQSSAGNPEAILEWLQTNAKDADYYVLSVDMLFSGGLVGSRDPFYDSKSIANKDLPLGSYTLSDKEIEIVNYITELSKEKHVVLFDTVMRLASTNAYGTWDMGAYNFFRYQYTLEDRKDLTGSDLTIDKIVGAYKVDASGNALSTVFNKVSSNYQGYGNDYKAFEDLYCRARERKLRISDALYSNCVSNVKELFIGVDDSLPRETIQSNEIRYLEEKLINGTNAILFAGADELGLMGISSVVTSIYGEINVKVNYFGNGKNWAADDYDHSSLSDNISKHIDGVGANVITSGTADMEVLILTRSAESVGSTNATQHQTDVTNLVARVKTNLANNIPTCVIDASAYEGYGLLADSLLAANINLTELLGFSAWNTVGNSTGVALSNATARAAYIKNEPEVTKKSNLAFLEAIAFSYIKDDAFKKAGGGKCFASPSYFYNEADPWLTGLNNSTEMLVKIQNGVGVTQAPAFDLRVANLNFPWHRSFEADFDIQFVEKNSNSNLLQTLYNSGISNDFSGGWWWSNANVGTAGDSNDHPWSQKYSTNLVDGVFSTNYGTNLDDALTKWYGIRYRVTEVDANGNPTGYENQNASSTNGICNMPSIEFAQPQDVDQVKINFLYQPDYSVYLPERIDIFFYDANGKLITSSSDRSVRKAEGTSVSANSNYWYNLTLDEVAQGVKLIVIRPYALYLKDLTVSGYTFPCWGWAMMDEIEVYGATPHVHDYSSVVTEPTCTELGFTSYTCSVCGYGYIDSYVNAKGHTPGEEAGCESDQTCTVCGEVVKEALGHDYNSVVTEPTCTEKGFTTHICNNCDDQYIDSYVDAKGHTPGQEADCENNQTCVDCGHLIKDAIGHDYSSVVTEPTCTQQGFTTHICNNCGDQYIDSYVDAKGHTPGEEADCENHQTCTVCGGVVKEALGHDYSSVVTEPTCTEKGFTTHTCKACGDQYIDSYVDAKGHTPGEEADCENNQVCTICGTVVKEAIGHDYSSAVTEPTCTEQGFTTHTCNNCGDQYIDSYVDAKGHTPGEEADCENDQACTVCGGVVKEALGHDYNSVVTEPTCTEQGFTTHVCKVCGDTSVDSYVDAKGHTPGKDADCENDQVCTVCGTVLTGTSGHHYVSVVTKPTCTEQGFTTHTCSRCDGQYIDSYVDAKGHTPGEEADCENDQACTVCGHIIKEAIGHDYSSAVTEPTCTEQGFTTHICNNCGDEYVDSYVDAKGHTPGEEADCENDQACTVCGHIIKEAIGHDYSSVVTEPTCTEQGFTTHTCNNCGDQYIDSYVDAKGHTSGEWIEDSIATPDSDGYRHKDCTICGVVLQEEHSSIEKLAIKGASLTLESNLVINYKVDKALFESVGYTNPYIVFVFNGVETTVTDYRIVGDRYVFDFVNINPHLMNDNVYATLYATYNGKVYSSPKRQYSVAAYCYNTLNKYNATDYVGEEYDELRTLLVDLLNYGAASQQYMNYKTNNFVNSKLTDVQKSWATAEDPALNDDLNTEYETIYEPTVSWLGAGLNLQNSVGMRFKFSAESIENLSVRFTNANGEYYIVTSDKFELVEDGVYYVYFEQYCASQMSEIVYAVVLENDYAVSNTISYSIESYAYAKQDHQDTNLADLVKAMMKYGNSAKAYVS